MNDAAVGALVAASAVLLDSGSAAGGVGGGDGSGEGSRERVVRRRYSEMSSARGEERALHHVDGAGAGGEVRLANEAVSAEVSPSDTLREKDERAYEKQL
jgi:hypothetical protein